MPQINNMPEINLITFTFQPVRDDPWCRVGYRPDGSLGQQLRTQGTAPVQKFLLGPGWITKVALRGLLFKGEFNPMTDLG